MPIHRQKKLTTAEVADSSAEQPVPGLPEQQQFRQHLRELARSGIRIMLERVMCEELDALIGVAWGESSPKRAGYRNGFYSRDLITSTGRIEDLKVPRDREGQFHTQVFEHYRRYEPRWQKGLPKCSWRGSAYRRWGKSLKR
jgi:putative transposase